MRKLFYAVPWVLLGVMAVYCLVMPQKGLIGPITLPADDGFRSREDVQWWYWTGHLRTDDGKRYGFEMVFFAFNSLGFFRTQLAQAAITDVDGNSFHFTEYTHYGLPDRTKNQFRLKAGVDDSLRAIGGDGKDHLHSEIDGYVLDLQAEALEKPVLHYQGDAHPYDFGGFTYYYSRERMSARGSLTIDGKAHQVEGIAWFDRQYGDLYPAIVNGWQWFAIQLDDDREIMLFDFRGKSADVERMGSLTEADGRTHPLGPEDYTVEALGEWTSPHTGCTYPMGWLVTIGDLKLKVEPLVVDQELRAKHHLWVGPEYWEGASAVSGDATGQAYVELNGYCRGVLEETN